MMKRREKMKRWLQRGQYAVELEVEVVYPVDDPSEPCLEPKTVRFLDEVAQRAEKGDLAYLRKVGRVFQAIDKVPQLPIIANATTRRLLSDLAKEKGGEITVRARVVESAGNRVRVLAGEGSAKKRR